jgi:hypothetical protein
MSLKLNTASGGSITLQEADTASNLTLTVPAQAGSIVTADSSGNVGIGTSTPRDVSGYVSLGLNDTTGGILDFFASGTRVMSLTGNSSNCTISTITNTPLTLAINTNDALQIDTSRNLKFNSGYGSVATAYGCRAWVNFNGTGTVAIRASGNVSSITDRSTGSYDINFSTAMPDINYSVIGTSGDDGSWGTVFHTSQMNIVTTSAVQILLSNNNGTGRVDDSWVNVAIFR